MAKQEAAAPKGEEGPKLKDGTLELSASIRKGLEKNKSDGVITETTDNYYANLPEGLSKDTVTAVSNYNTQFVAASAHAVGQLAIEILKANSKIDTVTAELKLGPHDVARHAVIRHKHYTFGSGSEKRESDKYGVMHTQVDTRSERNVGQLKVVRTLLNAQAAEIFGK